MDRFLESLAGLMPKGYAWPRNPDSVLMRVLSALAAVLNDLHEFSHATVRQWIPHRTSTRLAEWEAACGLPDACMGADQTEAERRVALFRRLRGPVIPFEDASLASPAGIEHICMDLGFEVRVRYNVPFRVGRNRAGEPLGVLDGVLHVVVVNAGVPFRVGLNQVGDRLIKRLADTVDLECYLRRILPARFALQFTYVSSF